MNGKNSETNRQTERTVDQMAGRIDWPPASEQLEADKVFVRISGHRRRLAAVQVAGHANLFAGSHSAAELENKKKNSVNNNWQGRVRVGLGKFKLPFGRLLENEPKQFDILFKILPFFKNLTILSEFVPSFQKC